MLFLAYLALALLVIPAASLFFLALVVVYIRAHHLRNKSGTLAAALHPGTPWHEKCRLLAAAYEANGTAALARGDVVEASRQMTLATEWRTKAESAARQAKAEEAEIVGLMASAIPAPVSQLAALTAAALAEKAAPAKLQPAPRADRPLALEPAAVAPIIAPIEAGRATPPPPSAALA